MYLYKFIYSQTVFIISKAFLYSGKTVQGIIAHRKCKSYLTESPNKVTQWDAK